MFQPIKEEQVAASLKRAAAPNWEGKGEGNDVAGPPAKARARPALLHEDLARAGHRDDNFVMALKP
eukprot:1046853-Pyramimonas_sp.AAC.1